ncbi:hypothetical protein [Myxococcus sp. NMCA1]|uniref:hypothetical protein n=1 Tax=Myxococcus sp. NMCA1 TaxID=2996785 RepID=UPI002285A51E|nr:hypothetical protein [Myxococcus sp. NMCA1]WAM24524.1 hypothetical protein OZ403_28880 [Myxococcus sp. NMCA1]
MNLVKVILIISVFWAGEGRAQVSTSGAQPVANPPAAAPVLVASSSTAHLQKGWPLVLSIGLLHPRAVMPEGQVRSVGDFVIEAPHGGWEQHLSIEIFFRQNRNSKQVQLPLRRVDGPVRRLVLTSDKSRFFLRYTLPPDETANLTAGQYLIVARLDTTRGSSDNGWRGVLNASQVFYVMEQSSALPSSEGCRRALAHSDYFETIGIPDEALKALDDYLPTAQPGTAAMCLNRRASFAEAAGDLKLARDYYCKASHDSTVHIWELEKSRKKGEQAPHYTRSIFDENCERLTKLFGKMK